MGYIKQKLTSIILLLLMLLSIVVLYLYTVGVYTTCTIDLADESAMETYSDNDIGGISTAMISHTEDGLLLKCNIQAGYAWPFCQATINIAEQWEDLNFDVSRGVDFSKYDDIYLKMQYEGVPPHRVRFYLRNYNEVYTDLDSDINSMKINEIVFSPNRYPDGQHISLSSFQVAGWWSSPRQIPLEYAGAELTNISIIEISTHGTVGTGPASILIQEISFRKQLIPKENLLIIMLVIWLTSALLYFIFRLHHSNTTLQQLEITLGELQATQKQLVESEKLASLGNLVAGVAHEINTPLGVCITYSSIIADTVNALNDQVNNNQLRKNTLTEQLEMIIKATEGTQYNLERADKLISSFKHLAVNADTSEKSTFAFNEVINDTVLSMQNILKQSRHNVTINCPDGLIINSYPGAISQILIGFIDNSIKHGFENMEEGSINISVTENGNTISMIYTDNGCGIEKKDMNNILEPFFTTKRNKGHVGLGLNTIHNVVAKMLNGKLDIYCDGDNVGVIIRVSFPIALDA
ncbi:MAG: HAMP domain-containing histidine kinase [Psychromonas sp.]|nr:HAMP domain-containing histidine kinase [Psychromonas sp.]